MKTKTIAEVGIVAALYAGLVLVFGAISYAQLQFRIAEILKPMVQKRKWWIVGIAIGNFLGNLASPFGILEYTLMPVTCLVWGWVCWYVGNMKFRLASYAGSLLYALGTALSVAAMLHYVLGIPFAPTMLYVGASETVLLLLGTPIMAKIAEVLEKKNL